MRKLKAHLEDNFAIYIVGTSVVVPLLAVGLYANFLVKLMNEQKGTNSEILRLIAEKSPEDLIAFTKALFPDAS